MDEIGPDGQARLCAAKVAVVGAGGLGCPLLQYLTAIGVGKICIIDDDQVDLSNLQRQVLYGIKDVGKEKAIIACELMKKMNHHVDVERMVIRIQYKNALQVFKDYDVVVDCTDNMNSRYVLNDACIMLDKPLVHAGIYKMQGQLSVFNYQGGPSYRCLFPEPQADDPEATARTGIYAMLPGIMGLMQANEVIKVILGMNSVLSGKLLIYHGLNQELNSINFIKNLANFDKTIIRQAFSDK